MSFFHQIVLQIFVFVCALNCDGSILWHGSFQLVCLQLFGMPKKVNWIFNLFLLHFSVELLFVSKIHLTLRLKKNPLVEDVFLAPNVLLGTGADNQNGNLRWHLPLGVRPPRPPLNGTNFQTFFYPLFSFEIESFIYETDFTLQKYHFEVLL